MQNDTNGEGEGDEERGEDIKWWIILLKYLIVGYDDNYDIKLNLHFNSIFYLIFHPNYDKWWAASQQPPATQHPKDPETPYFPNKNKSLRFVLNFCFDIYLGTASNVWAGSWAVQT